MVAKERSQLSQSFSNSSNSIMLEAPLPASSSSSSSSSSCCEGSTGSLVEVANKAKPPPAQPREESSQQQQQRQLPQQQHLSEQQLLLLLQQQQQQQQQQQSPQQLYRRRRVRFAEDALYYDNTVSTREDCAQLWYERQELVVFRATATVLSTELARGDKQARKLNKPNGYAAILEQAYEACCTATAATAAEVDNNKNDIESFPSLVDARRLSLCVNMSLTRLGLETMTLRFLQRGRRQRQRQLRAHLQEHYASNNTLGRNDNDDDEALRRSCVQASRPARWFAHQLALASVGGGGIGGTTSMTTSNRTTTK